MPKYSLVEEAANHCWSKNFLEVFREFFAGRYISHFSIDLSDFYCFIKLAHAETFIDAPQQMSGEQDLRYYTLFQQYLKLYENHLEGYIKSLDVSVVRRKQV